MRIAKQIGAVLVLVLAVIGFIACLAALVALWGFREPVKASVTGALTTDVATLQTVEQGLREQSAALGGMRESLTRIDTVANQANPSAAASAQLARTVNDDLLPKISAALDVAAGLQQKLSVLGPALDALRRIPFITVPLLPEGMDALSQRIADAQQSVQNLRTSLDQMSADPATAPRITTETARISTAVTGAQSALDGHVAAIATTRQSLVQTSAAMSSFIDRLTLFLTVLLPVLAVGQVALFLQAWHYLHHSVHRGE